MTPLEIEILFHYYTRGCDYRDGDFSAPAVRSTIDAFNGDLGLLEIDNDNYFRTYRTTEKAEAWLKSVCALPLPICEWVIPDEPR